MFVMCGFEGNEEIVCCDGVSVDGNFIDSLVVLCFVVGSFDGF